MIEWAVLGTIIFSWLAYYFWPPHKVAGWYAGPIIKHWLCYRKNYSKATLEPSPNGVLQCDLIEGLDALCLSVNKLSGSFTIEYELSGTVTPTESPSDPLISVAFQRRGDNWTAEGKYQHYRWYAVQTNVMVPGRASLTVNFDEPTWTDVYGAGTMLFGDFFEEAKANPSTLFITFGGAGGRSHGVAGPALFKLLSVSYE